MVAAVSALPAPASVFCWSGLGWTGLDYWAAWAGLGWAAVIGCFKAITSVLAVPAAAFVQRVPTQHCDMTLGV